jgi:hypothetical protein
MTTLYCVTRFERTPEGALAAPAFPAAPGMPDIVPEYRLKAVLPDSQGERWCVWQAPAPGGAGQAGEGGGLAGGPQGQAPGAGAPTDASGGLKGTPAAGPQEQARQPGQAAPQCAGAGGRPPRAGPRRGPAGGRLRGVP